jgi:Cof subfamily protein (haloacid dehalogenase superfamily)
MERVVFKLVAIDLDGTLLSSNHCLSARTRAALTALIARGQHVVIATGRPFEMVREFCPGIPFVGPQITYNGAVVYDPVADRPMEQTLLPPRYVHDVLTFLQDEDIPAVACASDAVYLDRERVDEAVWVPPRLRPARPISEVWQGSVHALLKIAGDSDPAAIARVRPHAEEAFGGVLYVTQTAPRLIEFLNPQVSKGAALWRIMQTLDIEADEVLVFGDSHNDLTMFGRAGLRVAMGNASDEVKDAADRISLTNDEDGVAVVLEELMSA